MARRSTTKPLAEYERKRDFRKTPEPGAGRGSSKRAKPIFVIQKHDATRLHYDFRLEINGVLASWAVPKGPSLDPDDKRLAVHVEDHPLDYATFEGVIPKGEYGGGPVIVWDNGTWETDDPDPAAAVRKGKLTVTLHGKKLRGTWTLARMRGRGDDDKDNWLLIKQEDEFATTGGGSIVDDLPRSVLSERTIEELARSNGHAPKKTAKPAKAPRESARPPEPSTITNAKRMKTIPEYSAQLCTLADAAPSGEGWVHEIKFDGYRLLAHKTRKGVTLISRNGHDWTARFRPIADAVRALACDTCVIDGEATIVDAKGKTSFQRLQNSIKTGTFDDLTFFAFDLLYLDGFDVTRAPLLERKAALRAMLPGAEDGAMLRYSEHLDERGDRVLGNACDLGLEGIICKRADAPYAQTRSKTWLKVKCSKRQEFVIVGWTPPGGSRKHFGALLLGAHDADGRLVYTGRVGTGFNEATLKDLAARMKPLARKTTAVDGPILAADRREAKWIEPRLVAEIEFTEWTDDGRLRHPSYQGLREDKDAKDVKVETARPVETVEAAVTKKKARSVEKKKAGASRRTARTSAAKQSATKAPSRRAAKDDAVVIADVTLTNPERVLYPEQGLTKRDLAEYYEAVSEWMMPYLRGRPLSTVRCPQGRSSQCFFQKHIRDSFGDAVKPIRVAEQDGEEDYISVESVEGIITLVQFGVLEIHPWGATENDLDKPDMLTFDLDPAEDVSLAEVKRAATDMRALLRELGLESFVKTTGGKGLHVVVPLTPSAGWDEAKAFCAEIAKGLAQAEPKRYIAKASKAARTGKVFVDYLRNSRGATSVAPYSSRARAGAPVAMPLRWEELGRLKSPAQYTVQNALRRLRTQKEDPWGAFFETAQKLPTLGGR